MTQTCTPSSYDGVVLADRPVAFWDLGGGRDLGDGCAAVPDRTGHGHDGRAHGGPGVTEFVNGDPATVFDGAGQYVEVPDHPALSVTATGILAVEAWLRPDVLEFPHQEGTHYVHWLGKGDTDQHEYVARMYSHTTLDDPPRPNRISGYAFDLGGGLGTGSYFQDRVVAGRWIHYLLVVNTVQTDDDHPTGYTKIFKNGRVRDQDALTSFGTTPGDGTAPFRIATRDFRSFFLGALAKVAVYDRELPPEAVRAHHRAAGITAGATPL
jgi:Concanavalin A-like lectin/glucanases superfamily